MQINLYDANRLLQAFQSAGFGRIHLEQTDHGGFWGLLFFAQKSSREDRA